MEYDSLRDAATILGVIRDTGRPSVRASRKLFVAADAPVVLVFSDVVLRFETDAPWWGLWLNYGEAGVRCIGVEATNVAGDSAHDVRDALEPGATLQYRWTLRCEVGASEEGVR
jgi:hypothetical protein